MLFVKADRKMERLGFEKIEESKFGASYRKENKPDIRLCAQYRDDTEVAVIRGRQTVDERRLLGVMSLIGHFVTVRPVTNDSDVAERFGEDLERIKNDGKM